MKLNSEAYFQVIKISPGPKLKSEVSTLGPNAGRRPRAGELTQGLSPRALWLGIRVLSQEGAHGLRPSLTTLFHLPRSERQLPLPQPQGGGMEQPGPQQLPGRGPARSERTGEGGLGAGGQVRAGEEERAWPGRPPGAGDWEMEGTQRLSEPRRGRKNPGWRPTGARRWISG